MDSTHHDFLQPIGHAGADYVRNRLKRRVMLEMGITLRPPVVRKTLRCLDEKATVKRIQDLRDEAWFEVSSPVWPLEMEALLTEIHGSGRYEDHRTLEEDLMRAARHYTISHVMDSLLADCNFHTVFTREERLDSAAFYAVPREERT